MSNASAAKSRIRAERTVHGSYGPYSAPVSDGNEVPGKFPCLVVPTHSTEGFFTATAADGDGRPVFVEVTTTGSAVFARFCGETAKPIAFDPGAELRFHVAMHDGRPTTDRPNNRITTTGTVRVTLRDAGE